jgi:O-antigen ligase
MLLGGVAGVAALGAAAAVMLDPVLAVAAIVGVAGCVAVYLEPRMGLIAIGVFTVLRLPDVATDYHGAPSLFTPLIAIILFSVAIRSLHSGTRPAGGGRAAIAIATLAAVATASLLFAADVPAGIRELGFLVKDGAVAILVGLLLTRSSQLRTLTWVLIGGGLFLSALTTVQYLTNQFGTTFGGFAQSAVQEIVGGTDDIRISGPIGDPNFYAQWLIMLVPLAIDRYRDETNSVLRAVAALTTVTCTASIVFTFSRGALVALVVVIGLMALRHPPRPSTIIAVLTAGILIFPLLPSGYVDRMAALADLGGVDIGTDVSLRNRQAEGATAIRMFLDKPLLGIGYGNYLSSYTSYSRDLGIDLTRKPREAHNLYLETAAEMGVPGILALMGVFGAAFVALSTGRRRFREMGDLRTDSLGHAIGVALVGYLLTSIFLHMAFARLMWLLVGMALAFPSTARSENRIRDEGLVSA